MSSETPQMNLPSNWTEQEKWVWEKLSRGKIADFTAEEAKGELSIKTEDSQEWSEKTVISPAFLQTILLDEAYRGTFPWSGVKIIGAWIKEPLFLEDAALRHPWWMDRCRFEAEVNLIGLKTPWTISLEGSKFKGSLSMLNARVGGQLNMSGSTFSGELNMNGLAVQQSFSMRGGAQFAKVNLVSARVGGQLDMSGSTFTELLNMNSLAVEQSFSMRGGAQFAGVNLTGTKVGGQLDMTGSTFTELLNMNSLAVEQSLFMRGGAQFAGVNLTGARVGGQLDMTGSTFTGSLSLEHIHIALDLFMREIVGPVEEQMVNLIFAKILGNLAISGSQIPSLDLTGTKISGELCLGPFSPYQPIKWWSGAKLTLRNTDVGALQDHHDSWPEILDLNGFTYARLGGWDPKGENPVTNRETSWFCRWLEKQPDYSPQPYQQLASVLVNMGHRMESDEILYAGRERERKSTNGWARAWMTLLKEVIGYGYKTWLALGWAILAVLVGTDVLIVQGILWPHQIAVKGIPEEFAYSLDMLLPGVQLDKHHFDIVLDGGVKYYFYFQRLMGVILGSFLIAGLSGLTKK